MGFSRIFQKFFVEPATTIPTKLQWGEPMGTTKLPQTTAAKASKLKDELPTLQDKTVTIFTTEDHKELAIYLPQGLQHPFKKTSAPDPVITALRAIEKYVTTAPPPMPKRDKKRYPHSSDPQEEDKQKELWKAFVEEKVAEHGAYGAYNLGFWHGHGHTHVPANIAADMVRTPTRYIATHTFYEEMAPIFQIIGRLF